MKNGLLVGVLVGLAGTFVFANAPAYAQPAPQDLSITSAKADITYETAPRCLNSSNSVVSCSAAEVPLRSDTFQINANVDTTNATDLGEELTTYGMGFFLQPGPCDSSNDSIQPNSNYPLFLDAVPKLSENSSSKKWDIYTFEGPVPSLFPVPVPVPGQFGNVEVQLKVNKEDPTQSTLHLEGNASLCEFGQNTPSPVTGQMCLSVANAGAISAFPYAPDFYDGGSGSLTGNAEADGDFTSVTVTPDYGTNNVSTAFCPLQEFFQPF